MAYQSHRGVEITDTYFTGHKGQVLSTLIRSMGAIARSDRTWGGIYVGIASGVDYWQALSRRIDDYKLSVGISRMYLLYESRSELNTRWLEDQLVEHIREVKHADDVLNRIGGGGGRPSAGPLYYLYLAVRPG